MSQASSMAIEILNHSTIVNRCQELAALLTRYTNSKENGAYKTGITQLEFIRESSTSIAVHGVHKPLLCIVVQGEKQALLGEETYRYGVAQYLVVSVDLPLSGFVIKATPDKPYLGFRLKLDLATCSALLGKLRLHLS
jgi:hypothetical protein